MTCWRYEPFGRQMLWATCAVPVLMPQAAKRGDDSMCIREARALVFVFLLTVSATQAAEEVLIPVIDGDW